MLDWFDRIPWQINFVGLVAGALLSAFSGRLPEAWQDVGLYTGLLLGLVFIIGLALHAIKERRGGKKVEPCDLIVLGLGGMTVFTVITLSGVIWQRFGSPPPALPIAAQAIAPPPNEALTPFQLDQRLKVIEQIDDVVTGPISAAFKKGERLWMDSPTYLKDGTFEQRLAEFQGAYDSAFETFETVLRNNDKQTEIVDAVRQTNWDYREMTDWVRSLQEALKFVKSRNLDQELYMANNQYLMMWANGVTQNLLQWIDQKRSALRELQAKYEAAAKVK